MLALLFSRRGLALAAAVALAGVLVWSHHSAYQAGRTAEQAAFMAKLNQENVDAGKAAEDWRARYRRCAERGGLYSFENGACDD